MVGRVALGRRRGSWSLGRFGDLDVVDGRGATSRSGRNTALGAMASALGSN